MRSTVATLAALAATGALLGGVTVHAADAPRPNGHTTTTVETTPTPRPTGGGTHRFLEAWDSEGIKWGPSGRGSSARASSLLTPSSYFPGRTTTLGKAFRDIADAILEMLRRELAGPSFVSARGFLIDDKDNLYLLSGSGGSKHNPFAIPNRRWKPGPLIGPAAFGPDGRVYGINGKKQFGLGVFDGKRGRAVRMITRWEDVVPDTEGRFDELTPVDIAVDGAGNFFVFAESREYVDGYSTGSQLRVLKLNPRGQLIGGWPVDPGSPLGADRGGIDIAGRTLYLNTGSAIEKRSLGGELTGTLKVGAGPLTGVAVDRKGRIYTIAVRTREVLKLSRSGKRLSSFKTVGRGRGKPRLADLDVDSRGNIYVSGKVLHKYVPRSRMKAIRKCDRIPVYTRGHRNMTKKTKRRIIRCVSRAVGRTAAR